MILTLDDFANIMHYDPCVFMGVKLAGLCDPLDCKERDRIVTAAETAFGMMQQQAAARGFSLLPAPKTLESYAPYFNLSGNTAQTLATTQYEGTITYLTEQVGDLACDDLAEIEATIDPLDADACESIQSVALSFADCTCKRLGVKLCSAPTLGEDGVTLTFYVKAYNLIDIDNVADDHSDAGIPYLETVMVDVTIATPSKPWVYFEQGCCANVEAAVPCGDACCEYDSVELCMIPRRNGIYDVMDNGNVLCNVTGNPVKYVIDVMANGLWQAHWSDALVSLMNTLIPADFCSCNPLTNSRWMDDQGVGEKWAGTYRYSYWNDFGIPSPGAQKAWKTLQTAMNNSMAVIM